MGKLESVILRTGAAIAAQFTIPIDSRCSTNPIPNWQRRVDTGKSQYLGRLRNMLFTFFITEVRKSGELNLVTFVDIKYEAGYG